MIPFKKTLEGSRLEIENLSKTFIPLVDKEIKKIIKSKSDNLYRGMNYAVDGGKN